MKVKEWIRVFGEGREIRNALIKIYGEQEDLLGKRRGWYRGALYQFAKTYGHGEEAIIVRAPARINLMGVHIEHRGGYVNYVPISREIMMVVQKRDDDLILLHNTESEQFPPRSFHIRQELPPEKRGDWAAYIRQVRIKPGDWGNYLKAAVLSLQNHYGEQELRGMNIMVSGNIPPSSGLSSSSALVVATALAVVELNNLNISREELVHLCGEGEWYVATRGGAGDHAAMLFGKRGFISHLRFFPFTIEYVSPPGRYRILICNSLRKAEKSAEVKNIFNEKIATYEIALWLIRKRFPAYADRLKHLRDVNEENLGVDTVWIYEMLKSLPERVSRKELLSELPAKKAEMDSLFETHREPSQGYKVRQVCLFGLAECQRSDICVDFLRRGDIEGFGRLMYISHNGDRLVSFDERGQKKKWDNRVSDEYLDDLILNLKSGNPERKAESSLYLQPGGYGCSCEELDQLVDISRGVEGVVGAGLTGAGLGGCVLVMVEEGKVGKLLEVVGKKYYRARGLPLAAEVCLPSEGAGLIEL